MLFATVCRGQLEENSVPNNCFTNTEIRVFYTWALQVDSLIQINQTSNDIIELQQQELSSCDSTNQAQARIIEAQAQQNQNSEQIAENLEQENQALQEEVKSERKQKWWAIGGGGVIIVLLILI